MLLYKALDDSQREIFIEVLRQTAIDTVSSVFALVDGVASFEGQESRIRFSYGDDDLAGELQDEFLKQFEEE
ncbi:MAG: hypothetical protein ABI557_13690 [Aureliella sp.]